MICTINPLLSNYQETTNTLKFGLSAGAVKNQVRINERLSEKSSLMKEQIKELNDYKTEMSKNKEIYESKVVTQTSKIDELEKKIVNLLDENNKIRYEEEKSKEQGIFLNQKCKKFEEEFVKMKRDNESLKKFYHNKFNIL